MREITSHKINGCNESITIMARDEPSNGGANHHYRMTMDGGLLKRPTIEELEAELAKENTVDLQPNGDAHFGFFQDITFQKGPIKEAGVNGITHEALLAILIDRLEGFQAGPFKHEANEHALKHLRDALAALKSRTVERMARGIEGTHTV